MRETSNCRSLVLSTARTRHCQSLDELMVVKQCQVACHRIRFAIHSTTLAHERPIVVESQGLLTHAEPMRMAMLWLVRSAFQT